MELQPQTAVAALRANGFSKALAGKGEDGSPGG